MLARITSRDRPLQALAATASARKAHLDALDRVRVLRLDPDVDVDRGAWVSMYRKCVCSDDQKTRFLGHQRGQNIVIVVVACAHESIVR